MSTLGFLAVMHICPGPSMFSILAEKKRWLSDITHVILDCAHLPNRDQESASFFFSTSLGEVLELAANCFGEVSKEHALFFMG